MFTYEYRFYPKQFDEEFLDDFEEELFDFLASLWHNGTILEHWQNTVKFDTYYASRVITPEKDSLDEKYYNKYNAGDLRKVTDKSLRAPEYEYIGENRDVSESCACADPSHYVMGTSYMGYVSPVRCGDCLSPVPLYKLPKTYDDSEYYNILNWQKVYRACDMQFMIGVGERHGYRMIHHWDSDLSRQGRGICRLLEEKTGKPFYYFLYDYYEKNKRECPICKKNWVNEDPDKYDYDYICHDCRIVSR